MNTLTPVDAFSPLKLNHQIFNVLKLNENSNETVVFYLYWLVCFIEIVLRQLFVCDSDSDSDSAVL